MTAAALIGLPILYLILQWSAIAQMRRGWRRAALLPALFLVVALGMMVVGIALGWPTALLGLMIGLPVATLYLLILWPLHLAFSWL